MRRNTSVSPGSYFDTFVENLHGFKASGDIIFYRISGEEGLEFARISQKKMDLKNRIKE